MFDSLAEKLQATLSDVRGRGTLTEEPKLLEPAPSADQQTLMQSFASGLQKCQPYTMLPQDHYEQWKTLDLVVHPHNYLAQ